MKEIWEDIIGWDGLYQVSDLGRVKSVERIVVYKNGKRYLVKEKILRFKRNGEGYLSVCLCRNCYEKYERINRLVANAFIPNPNNYPIVCHDNDVPDDNRVVNLKWGTQKHNIRDAVKRGRMSKGDSHYMRNIPTSKKPTSRLVLDGATGIFYDCIKDAAIAKGLNIKKTMDHLYHFEHGMVKKNKTSLILV